MYNQIADLICTAAHNYDGACIDSHSLINWAFENGFYSYLDTIDDDGNLLDSEKVISFADWQEIADIFAPGMLNIINM